MSVGTTDRHNRLAVVPDLGLWERKTKQIGADKDFQKRCKQQDILTMERHNII